MCYSAYDLVAHFITDFSITLSYTRKAVFSYINNHYIDVIMTTMASQIISLAVVYSTVYSDADQRKHQSSASLAFVWGIHRDRWIPRTKGLLRGKCFHLMTSSWIWLLKIDLIRLTAPLGINWITTNACNEWYQLLWRLIEASPILNFPAYSATLYFTNISHITDVSHITYAISDLI